MLKNKHSRLSEPVSQTVSDPQAMITQLHEAFGHPEHESPQPNPLRNDTATLRYDLIFEEFLELSQAYSEDDPVKYFDALLDLVVVIYGDAATKG